MLNGLDLFSGIGGLSYALAEWVRPVAYCEIEAYARGVLLSRMFQGELPVRPIWDDVKTLHGRMLPSVDIIYGGFPCQDISVAGLGKGLEGERSGLFFEILRLVDEARPKFIFLENVPAITIRGLSTVTAEITKRGYDCRWCTLSAQEVGAPHKRERWWLLAYSNGVRKLQQEGGEQEIGRRIGNLCQNVSYPRCEQSRSAQESEWTSIYTTGCSWWSTEPDVGRVANGIPCRVDRIRGLGNAVVPLQAREAFKRLMGLTEKKEG